MKLINLIPPQEKERKFMSKLKKASVSSGVILLSATGAVHLYEGHTAGQHQQVQQKLSENAQLTNQLEQLHIDQEAAENRSEVFESSVVPYHRLFYSISNHFTEDMKLLMVRGSETEMLFGDMELSEEEEAEREAEEAEKEAEEAEREDYDDVVDGLDEDDNESEENQDEQNGGGEEDWPEDEEVLEEKKQEVLEMDNEVRIHGYALNADSVSYVIEQLRQEDFVLSADIVHLDGYYTGTMTYKVFEIQVTVR